MLSFVTKYPFTLIASAVIVVLSLMPTPEVPPQIEVPLMDKWVHMLMYVVLCMVLWTEYWRCHRRESLKQHLQDNALRIIALAIIAPLTLGGAMELLQAFATTYRSGDWLDFSANSIGVAAGTAVGLSLGRLISGRKIDKTASSVHTKRY